MQNITAPAVFNPRAFFDGKKNLFSVGPLKMQGTAAEVRETLAPDDYVSQNTRELTRLASHTKFVVSMSDRPQPPGSTRGQFSVRLTKVNDM